MRARCEEIPCDPEGLLMPRPADFSRDFDLAQNGMLNHGRVAGQQIVYLVVNSTYDHVAIPDAPPAGVGATAIGQRVLRAGLEPLDNDVDKAIRKVR